MKVVAIIPARSASTRFPGKVIAPILGKPMIQRVWERTKLAMAIDQVVVATDDERVGEVVMGFGGHVLMTSPDHMSGTERVAEAAGKLEADVIINVQGDEPIINPESLLLVIGPFLQDDVVAMTSLKYPIATYSEFIDPNVVKVVCDDLDNAIYFSRSPIPCYRDGRAGLKKWEEQGTRPKELKPVPMKHIGVYAYRSEFLQAVARFHRSELEEAEKLEQLRVLAWGFKIRMITTPHDAVSVDVPEDVAKVERIMKEKGLT
jgi:3-deoxy-manno-octulosonate cytidylyltransferase (CMP-KDO synthetase)